MKPFVFTAISPNAETLTLESHQVHINETGDCIHIINGQPRAVIDAENAPDYFTAFEFFQRMEDAYEEAQFSADA